MIGYTGTNPWTGQGIASDTGTSSAWVPFDWKAAIRPLLERMCAYDEIRTRIENEGGRLSDLNRLWTFLRDPIQLDCRSGSRNVSLIDPAGVRKAVQEIGCYNLHFDVRRLDTRMPVYCVCRTMEDYWSQFTLVVEDLYRGPRYPVTDSRFLRLMTWGHEQFFIDLSPYRETAARVVDLPSRDREGDADNVLYDVGRYVLDPAWHEDQRMGMLAARHFGMPSFGHAIELLYLLLTGDLCRLRGSITVTMVRFFEVAYPQPAIRAILSRLPDLDGEALNAMPRRALTEYSRLSEAFGRFLSAETRSASGRGAVPVYTLLLSNFNRFDKLAPMLDERARAAAAELNGEAEQIIEEMISW